jgi:hypothetical protein
VGLDKYMAMLRVVVRDIGAGDGAGRRAEEARSRKIWAMGQHLGKMQRSEFKKRKEVGIKTTGTTVLAR